MYKYLLWYPPSKIKKEGRRRMVCRGVMFLAFEYYLENEWMPCPAGPGRAGYRATCWPRVPSVIPLYKASTPAAQLQQ